MTAQSSQLNHAVTQGAFWMLWMRWAVRGLGIISTLFLARLLSPADFGLVAIATLFSGLISIGGAVCADLAIIHLQTTQRSYWNTAWSIQILQGSFVAILIVLSAPWISAYYQMPQISFILWIQALGFFIDGLSNVGIIDFRLKYQFHKEFQLTVFKKISAFLCTLCLAWILQSYLALIYGVLAGHTFKCLASYWMHGYRPRFSLAKLKTLWSISQWMLCFNISSHVEDKSDEFVVSKLASLDHTGAYTVSYELANLTTNEFVQPIERALFPGYSQLLRSQQATTTLFLHVIGTLSIFSIPASIGIFLLAAPLTELLLGPQWSSVVPMLKSLVFLGIARALCFQISNFMVASGYYRLMAYLNTIHAVILIPSCYLGWQYGGILGIAWAKTIQTTLFLGINLEYLRRYFHISYTCWLKILIRPIIASAWMYLFLNPMIPALAQMTVLDSLWILLSRACLGALAYGSGLLFLWIISGRPPHAEYQVLKYVSQYLRNLKHKYY